MLVRSLLLSSALIGPSALFFPLESNVAAVDYSPSNEAAFYFFYLIPFVTFNDFIITLILICLKYIYSLGNVL